MKRIIILNSYTLTDRDAGDMVRIKYFLKGLEERGYVEGKNIRIDIIDSNDLGVIEKSLAQIKKSEIDLIHAVGTPNAAIAAGYSADIPIVYYGAHPEGAGVKECKRHNTCGLELTLPFTGHYKNFRFIKKLLPGVKNVYVPFYENTIFCPESMKKKSSAARKENKTLSWLAMDSPYIGYRSLAGLCYIIGINYFEFLYREAGELSGILSTIEPGAALIMPYNDSVYCRDAPGVLLKTSLSRKIPLLWNNNPEATRVGAVAAIAGCFKESGWETGLMAAKILDGTAPAEIGYRVSTKSYASINPATAKNLGIEFPAGVLSYFAEVLEQAVNMDDWGKSTNKKIPEEKGDNHDSRRKSQNVFQGYRQHR